MCHGRSFDPLDLGLSQQIQHAPNWDIVVRGKEPGMACMSLGKTWAVRSLWSIRGWGEGGTATGTNPIVPGPQREPQFRGRSDLQYLTKLRFAN